MKNFQNRIEYKGEMAPLLKDVCKMYQLEEYVSHDVLEIGYEDFNLILTTTKDKYFVKIFASYRTSEEIDRYVQIMLKAIAYDINHPALYPMKDTKSLYIKDYKGETVELVVMQYIPAKNLYETKEKLFEKDVIYLARQAARINQLDIEPIEVYDVWSVVNISKEFGNIKSKLEGENRKLASETFKEIQQGLDFNELPWCFVHGDLTRSNLIKEGEKLRIIDFSVSNVNPRIQELAVIFCNTIFDPKQIDRSRKMYDLMVEEYQIVQKLEQIELEKLPLYIKAGFLTNIIGTTKLADSDIDAVENEYWKNLGYDGLRSSILTR